MSHPLAGVRCPQCSRCNSVVVMVCPKVNCTRKLRRCVGCEAVLGHLGDPMPQP